MKALASIAVSALLALSGASAGAASQTFTESEEALLAAAAGGEVDAVVALARFYMSHDLWIEALARVRDLTPAPAQLIAAEAEYRMGRYRAAAGRLRVAAPQDPLRAMALAKLGAYDAARVILDGATSAVAPARLRADFVRMRAETQIATGDFDGAAATLAGGSEIAGFEASNFLTAKIREGRSDKTGAQKALRQAAFGETNEWSMRARLALAGDARDISMIETLALEWRGGAFERDLRLILGRRLLADKNYDRGFRELARLVSAYPESLEAFDAQSMIEQRLPDLFGAESGLHPKEAARVFFDHVEFAPPGAEGDALIREATQKLSALGLYRQAAQLLDHQVAKRLRGEERARVAADLADMHMAAENPAAALRAIRSTRIEGLAADVESRRRRTEATALAKSGRADNALALLSHAPMAEDLKLRAEINWSRRAWPEAARDYASYLETRAGMKEGADRTIAIRAATAFLLAGDRAGYRAFAGPAAERMGGAPEAALILSLGDVDQDEFLAKVLESYRAVYGR